MIGLKQFLRFRVFIGMTIFAFGCSDEQNEQNVQTYTLVTAEMLCDNPQSYEGQSLRLVGSELKMRLVCTMKSCPQFDDMGNDLGYNSGADITSCNECKDAGYYVPCGMSDFFNVYPLGSTVQVKTMTQFTNESAASLACEEDSTVCKPSLDTINHVQGVFDSTKGLGLQSIQLK